MAKKIGVWFPTVRTNTGTDVFTERLVEGLKKEGIRAEITWLPLRAEYCPWSVPIPKAPSWATVVHVNTWLHSRFLPKNLPVVATLHHSIHDPELRPYKGWLRAMYHQYWIAPNERRVMKKANQVIAVSQFVADMAKKTLCDVPMQVIYNGIDTDKFKPDPNVKKPHQPFRLLYVGSWITRKGVDLLAPIMRELGDGFVLHYTGGEAAEKDKPAMPSNMVDIGRLTSDEVVIAMQNADAFLFPTRSEGFGLVVAEAIACGLLVIANRDTCINELVSHGTNGLLCERNSIEEHVKNIINCKDNLLKQASDDLTLDNRFEYTSMKKGYLTLYKEQTP